MAARFKELIKKYGKVGIVVHCSISAASISGIYVAIKNNVDVESMIERTGLDNLGDKMLETIGFGKDKSKDSGSSDQHPETMMRTDSETTAAKEKNRTKELAASSGSALALAILLNKALIPVRIPITLAVTPAVARFLARRKLMKSEASEVVNGHWIGSVREGGNLNGVKVGKSSIQGKGKGKVVGVFFFPFILFCFQNIYVGNKFVHWGGRRSGRVDPLRPNVIRSKPSGIYRSEPEIRTSFLEIYPFCVVCIIAHKR